MYVINGQDVRDMLSMSACIDLMGKAAEMASGTGALLPLRFMMPLADSKGIMGMMPGRISEPPLFGVKIVNIIPENAKRGRSSHLGTLILYDADNGDPVAMIDAAAVTAVRTAAASAWATKILSREDSSVLALIGTGEQAHSHLDAILQVRPVKQLIIYGIEDDSVAALAAKAENKYGLTTKVVDTAEEAARSADIICTITGAAKPILFGDWLPDGVHLNAVGASDPSKMEIDTSVVKRSRYFVDYFPSAEAQAAELIACLKEAEVAEVVAGEIGEVANTSKAGRLSDKDVTVYRSLGNAAQDLCVGAYLLDQVSSGKKVQTVTFP